MPQPPKLPPLEGKTLGHKDNKAIREATEYDDVLGRLVIRRGVRGVAVTSRNGEMKLYQNGIPQSLLDIFIEVCLDIEYFCTVIARESDMSTRWCTLRVEAHDYEMVVSIEKTHLAFMYCDRPEAYNGENIVTDVDDDL